MGEKLSITVKIGNDSFNCSGLVTDVWRAFAAWLTAIGHPVPSQPQFIPTAWLGGGLPQVGNNPTQGSL